MDLSIDDGMWREGVEDQCEKTDGHSAQLSKQQLVQLIRSIILIEKVLDLLNPPDVFGANFIGLVLMM